MYAIDGHIYHQYTPNVSIYTSTMDPMGLGSMYLEIGGPPIGRISSSAGLGYLGSSAGIDVASPTPWLC